MNWDATPLHQRADLVDSIRRCHGVGATWMKSVRVLSELVDGTVEVFHVEHPISTRCYAWSVPDGPDRSRTFAVLDDGVVIDAASAAEHAMLDFERYVRDTSKMRIAIRVPDGTRHELEAFRVGAPDDADSEGTNIGMHYRIDGRAVTEDAFKIARLHIDNAARDV